jgi:hypothetical protein
MTRFENKINCWIQDRSLIVYLLLALALVGIMYIRHPCPFTHPQLYGEEGRVILAQQQEVRKGTMSIMDYLFTNNYFGYSYFLARFSGLCCSWVPLMYIPEAYLTISLLVMIACCLYVASHSSLPRLLAILFAFAVALIPNTGEPYVTLINLHFIAPTIIPFLCLEEPITTWKKFLIMSLVVFAVGLTGPMLLFMSPLFLIRFVRFRRSWMEALFFIVAGAVMSIQFHYIFPSTVDILDVSRGRPVLDTNIENWIQAVIVRPPVYLFFGDLLPDRFPVLCATIAMAVMALIFIAVMAERSWARNKIGYFVFAFLLCLPAGFFVIRINLYVCKHLLMERHTFFYPICI